MALDSRLTKFPFLEAEDLHEVAVVCHRNADADAYLSAYALSRLLTAVAPECKVDIVTPGGMTLLTQKLSRRFPHARSSIAILDPLGGVPERSKGTRCKRVGSAFAGSNPAPAMRLRASSPPTVSSPRFFAARNASGA